MKQFLAPAALAAVFGMLSVNASAQASFTERNDLINTTNVYSGVPMGVVDMNGDRLDDIIRLDDRKHLIIEYQTPGGNFTEFSWGQVTGGTEWALCIADIDQNGYNDIASGGAYNGMSILMANASGTDYTQSVLTNPGTFVQGTNFADINNDGWLDLFACHDDGESRIWGNDGAGNLVSQNGWIDMSTIPASDNSGNYGSTWTDFDNDGDLDLYIAKCRQNVTDPSDPRRINALFVNDGNNNYSEDAASANLKIDWQSWTAEFQDIDNDGDFDCFITNHDYESQLLENEGDGTFTDITDDSGIDVDGLPIQGLLRDFDNDGWVDLIVSGNEQSFWHNNGDKTFTLVDVFNDDDMESIAIGDLNHDGFLDVYAGYAIPFNTPSNINDKVWMNDGNENNWFVLTLEGVQSNINAVGARVEIHGDWGVQVREVRAGESYGITNTFAMHFGIGTSSSIDSVVVDWPAGGHEVYTGLEPNQFAHVVEGQCTPPNANITADGPTVFCTGDDVTLSVPTSMGNTYSWSDGSTGSSITVNAAGTFWCTVSNGTNCNSISGAITVEVDPEENPEILVSGETTFCEGSSLTLTATDAQGYSWSNGETTQQITVTASGTYSVETVGVCENGSSDDVIVEVLDSPDMPAATGATIETGQSATVTATGSNVVWFDAPTGGNEVAIGSPWTTPALTSSVTYYAEDQQLHGVNDGFGGRFDDSGNGGENNPNNPGWLIFDVWEPITIISAKVYAFGDAFRTVQLLDANDNLIEELSINMTDGEARYTLNFDVPVGDGWQLKCEGDPSLYRSSDLVGEYPFDLIGAGEIVESNFGDAWYYSFYDWELETQGTTCGSPRAAADVVVTPVGIAEAANSASVAAYPNPTTGLVNLSFELTENAIFDIRVMDAAGKIVGADKYSAAAGQSTHQLELNGFAPGIYFVEMTSANQQFRQRVVVE